MVHISKALSITPVLSSASGPHTICACVKRLSRSTTCCCRTPAQEATRRASHTAVTGQGPACFIVGSLQPGRVNNAGKPEYNQNDLAGLARPPLSVSVSSDSPASRAGASFAAFLRGRPRLRASRSGSSGAVSAAIHSAGFAGCEGLTRASSAASARSSGGGLLLDLCHTSQGSAYNCMSLCGQSSNFSATRRRGCAQSVCMNDRHAAELNGLVPGSSSICRGNMWVAAR